MAVVERKYLRADVERGFIEAYYHDVCNCVKVMVDGGIHEPYWVAVGWRSDHIWLMDFSTHYEFPAEMKPATVVRRMQERAADAVRMGEYIASSWEYDSAKIEYEVWCFIPPSQRLLGALETARSAGAQITLVTPDEVQERLRQTVLSVKEGGLDQAFVQAALMIRKAFGLKPE